MKKVLFAVALVAAVAGCSAPQNPPVAVAPPPAPQPIPVPKKKLTPIIIPAPAAPPLPPWKPLADPPPSPSPTPTRTPSRSQPRSRSNPAPPTGPSNRNNPQTSPRYQTPRPTYSTTPRAAPIDPGYVNTPAPAPEPKPVDWRAEAIADVDATGDQILATSDPDALSRIAAACSMTAYDIENSLPPINRPGAADLRMRAGYVASAYSLLAETARVKAKGFTPPSIIRQRVKMARDLARGKRPGIR